MTEGGDNAGSGRTNGASGKARVVHPPREAETTSPVRAAQGTMRAAAPRRFYREAGIGPARDGSGHQVLLDGRPARTPGKAALILPTSGLAQAVAAEWSAQAAHVDPASMPLTRLANTAIDGVRSREADVVADIVKYAGSDLLCYRATGPAGLVARQAAMWDPVLAWLAALTGTPLQAQDGIVHVAQPPSALAAIARHLAPADAFALTSLHTITTLTGSAALALAVHGRHIDADAAWTAAHVDEDWQIAQWGEDAEATDRRRRRKREMDAAAQMLGLL